MLVHYKIIMPSHYNKTANQRALAVVAIKTSIWTDRVDHLRAVSHITGALWAKRGESGIFLPSPRARNGVFSSLVIKRLLCRQRKVTLTAVLFVNRIVSLLCCQGQQNGSHRQVYMYCVYLPVVRLGTLGSNNATATRTSLEEWICVLSVFIAVIPTHLLCQM